MIYNQKMDVYVLTSAHNRFDTRIFHRESLTLAEKYNLTLVVLDGLKSEFSKIKIVNQGSRPKNKWLRALKANLLFSFYLIKVKKKTIVHFHDPELFLTGIFAKIIGFKLIYDMHEDLPSQISGYFPKCTEKVIKKFFAFCEYIFLQICDASISATPFTFDRVKSNKKFLVRNFPLYDKIFFDKKRQNIIISTGLVNNRRGLQVILCSFELLDRIDFEYMVVGDIAPKSAIGKFEKLLGHRFHHISYLPHQKLVKLLEKSKIGLAIYQNHPNHEFSLPNKVFEYMERGTALIASNFSSWKDYITDYKSGLFINKEDPLDLANKISLLLDNPKLQNEISENARILIHDKFNWQNEKEELLKCYKILSMGVLNV